MGQKEYIWKFQFTLLLLFSLILLWTLLCLWAILTEDFPGLSPERSHCPSHYPSPYLFSAQCFTWAQLHFYLRTIQCPPSRAVQGVRLEMSRNKRLAKTLSQTAETRWICWAICSWLSIPLCQKWVKVQSTQLQCYPPIQLLIPCHFSFKGDPRMCETYLPKTLGERGKENKTWTKLQNIEEEKLQK